MLPFSSSSSLSPPPPLLTTIAIQTAPPPAHDQNRRGGGMSPTVLIITGIAALVFIFSASIRLLLRHLARRRRSRRLLPSSRSSSPSLSDTTASSSFNPTAIDQKALIDSLPLFTLASSVAALPKSSPDCAVCLSRFDPDEQLRLLPACRHAFHSACIDAWLRSTPSCPLCRATVVALPAPADEADGPKPNPSADPDRAGSGRSGSFRLEIGSVSRRRDDAPPPSSGTPPQQHARTYSLGSSFDYVVEEEIEAVVAAVAAHVRRNSQPPPAKDAAAPGDSVAEVAGGSGRSWLKDYVDRLASSASSSFSSLRFSGRWSRRSDAGAAASAVGSWDLEGSYPSSVQQGGVTEEEMAPIYSFYRWLIGV